MSLHYHKYHPNLMVKFNENNEYVQSKCEASRKRKADINPQGQLLKQITLNNNLSLSNGKIDKAFQKEWDEKVCEFVAKTQCSFF